jgi:hypothetical protein
VHAAKPDTAVRRPTAKYPALRVVILVQIGGYPDFAV